MTTLTSSPHTSSPHTTTHRPRALTVWSWVLTVLTPVGYVAAFVTLMSVASLLDVGLGRAESGNASLWQVAVIVVATSIVAYVAPTSASIVAIHAVSRDEPGAQVARTVAFIALGLTVVATFLLGLFGVIAGLIAALIVALESYRVRGQAANS
jgi:hypothetical protein